MDRHLTINAKKGYLVAEIHFRYNARNQVTVKITDYNMYESEDPDTGEISYHTYELATRDNYVQHRQFKSMDELRQHDIDFAKKELWNKMDNPENYTFTYGEGIQQARYFIGRNHTNYNLGVADIQYNFDDNTKRLRFLSGQGLRWDYDMDGDCLEANVDLIARLPLYDDMGEPWQLSRYDIAIVNNW